MDNFYYNINSIDLINCLYFLVMNCRFNLKYVEMTFVGCSNVITFKVENKKEVEEAYERGRKSEEGERYLYFPVNSNEMYKFLTDPKFIFQGTFYQSFKKVMAYFNDSPKLQWNGSGLLPCYCVVIVKMDKLNITNETTLAQYVLLCNDKTVIDAKLLKSL